MAPSPCEWDLQTAQCSPLTSLLHVDALYKTNQTSVETLQFFIQIDVANLTRVTCLILQSAVETLACHTTTAIQTRAINHTHPLPTS
jgi:hypothetical protein